MSVEGKESMGVPGTAMISDIAKDVAVRAFRLTSMDPERQATDAISRYVNHINQFRDEVWSKAKNDRQREIASVALEDYRSSYIRGLLEYFDRYSRVASPTVVGPANFPVARNRKLLAIAERRATEFYRWASTARARIMKQIADARGEEEKLDEEWEELRNFISKALVMIQKADEASGGDRYSRAAFVKSIKGKVTRLAEQGQTALVARALEFIREHNKTVDSPAILNRNSIWALADTAANAASELPSDKEAPTCVLEVPGARVVRNPEYDRVQIFFDQVPSAKVRNALKLRAWRWCRSAGAWQRKLTAGGLDSAKQIVQSLQLSNGECDQ